MGKTAVAEKDKDKDSAEVAVDAKPKSRKARLLLRVEADLAKEKADKENGTKKRTSRDWGIIIAL